MLSSFACKIIYLERNTERWPKVHRILNTIPKASIFPAINGQFINFIDEEYLKNTFDQDKLLTLNDIEKQLSREQALSQAKTVLIEYDNHLFRYRLGARHLRFGYREAACALSHFYVIFNFYYYGKEEHLLILEDDTECSDVTKFIELLGEHPSDEYDLIHFHNGQNITLHNPEGKKFIPYKGGFNYACVYLLTRRGAKIILDFLQAKPPSDDPVTKMDIENRIEAVLSVPADDVLSILCQVNKLKVLFVHEKLWSSDTNRSSIWQEEDYNKIVWDKPLFPVPTITVEIGKENETLEVQVLKYCSCKAICLEREYNLKIKPGSNYLLDIFPYIRQYHDKTNFVYSRIWRPSTDYDISINRISPFTHIDGEFRSNLYFIKYSDFFKTILKDVSY